MFFVSLRDIHSVGGVFSAVAAVGAAYRKPYRPRCGARVAWGGHPSTVATPPTATATDFMGITLPLSSAVLGATHPAPPRPRAPAPPRSCERVYRGLGAVVVRQNKTSMFYLHRGESKGSAVRLREPATRLLFVAMGPCINSSMQGVLM